MLTKFDIASAALVTIGANPISSFDSPTTVEEIACKQLYQIVVDQWLSIYPWRFASRTTQLSRSVVPPATEWQAAYIVPPGMKAMQGLRIDKHGTDMPYDRYQNLVLCNASETQAVWCVHTYEPAIAWWPGYFTSLITMALAARIAFTLSGKLDLAKNIADALEKQFPLAKNADSRQQTARRLKVTGRNSIMEARRA